MAWPRRRLTLALVCIYGDGIAKKINVNRCVVGADKRFFFFVSAALRLLVETDKSARVATSTQPTRNCMVSEPR